MTEKLYDSDAYLRGFSARVAACAAAGERWRVELDRTAFFPEGGGQPADTGTIGEARVLDVREEHGRILHTVDRPLEPGEEAACALDWEQRLRRMQNHSGEHVFSGLAHSLFGCENVGFHMGADCMTIDFDRELDAPELDALERAANEAVRADLPIRAWYPSAEELGALRYRSKKELEGAVRLVEVEGVDLCACCAPHVRRTGEIGSVKLLSAERHRGGVRLGLICGMDAWEDHCRRQKSAAEISRLLSVPRDGIAPAVARLLGEQERQKERVAALSMALAEAKAAALPETGGCLCVFDTVLDEVALRELVNRMAEKCAVAAAFSGSDEEGYRYIIGSRRVDLRARAGEINAAIGGRGGGSAAMLQGRASAPAAQITRFWEQAPFLDTMHEIV